MNNSQNLEYPRATVYNDRQDEDILKEAKGYLISTHLLHDVHVLDAQFKAMQMLLEPLARMLEVFLGPSRDIPHAAI